LPSPSPHYGRRNGVRPAVRAGWAGARRCRSIRVGVLLGWLLGGAAVVVSAADADPPLLSAEGAGVPPAELGARLGRLAKQAFSDLERRWDGYLVSQLDQADFDRLLAERVGPLRVSGVDAATRDEVEGFAAALTLVGRNRLGDGRLSLDELWLVQFLPDIAPVMAGSALVVIGRGRAGRRVLVGRNLDWGNDARLRDLQAITRWRRHDRTLVSPGFAGFLGVLSGFNDRGLYAALLSAPSPAGSRTEVSSSRAIAFALRRALARCATADCAARLLRAERYTGSHGVLLADPGDAVVLELPAGRPGLLRRADSATRPEMPWARNAGQRPAAIAAVNCLVSAGNAVGCGTLADRYRWQRFRQLAQGGGLSPAPGATTPGDDEPRLSDLRQILLDRAQGAYAIFNDATAQSMLFDPASGDLLLYAAADSARTAEPVMRRYAGLARPSAAKTAVTDRLDWLLLSLSLALAVAAVVWGWRRRGVGG